MSDQDYWERHARNYNASMRWVLGRPIPRLLELAAEAVRGKDNVLEVAAGTGIVTTAIAQTCESVEATDYASAMIEELRVRVRKEELNNVSCAQADIYSLPYQADSFDAVVAANVLHLIPDLPAALEALRHVTKPGGMLVAPTFCHDETRTSWLLSRLLAATSFPVKRRFTVQSLEQALQDNGLRVGHLESIPGLIPIGYVEAQFQ